MQFLFANHTLDTDRRELRRGGMQIDVEPQVFDVLTYLLENRERVVSKDDLFASVWRGRIVADSTLASRINAARKAVGDSASEQKLIRTIARRGIRFVGDVDCQPVGGARVQAAPRVNLQPRPSSLPPPDRPAIAVLAFANMSDDPSQEYFLLRLRRFRARSQPYEPNIRIPAKMETRRFRQLSPLAVAN